MSFEDPKVSVLICTYNAERFIRSCLDSVLAQSYSDFNILVVDNHSQDSTMKILTEYEDADRRIKCYGLSHNLGAFGGLNLLLEKTGSKYVAILDHDDIWHPEKLSLQVELMDKRAPMVVGCGGAALQYVEKKAQGCIVTKSSDTICFHPSLMFLNENQRYDTTVKYKTDTHFMQNILCADGRKLINLNHVLYLNRFRSDGMNLNNLWLTPRNALSYCQRERSLKSLLALVLSITPDPIRQYIRPSVDTNLKDIGHFFSDPWLAPMIAILNASG